MPRLRIRQLCPLAAIVLLAAFVPAAGQALAAQSGPHLRSPHLRAPQLSAASIRDSASAATAAPAGTPPKRTQIKVLTAALANMTKHYASFVNDEPGPVDILDYGIGALWRKGIDGAGTTIGLLEGWNFPQINSIVKGFDKPLGLPNPRIQTIYPTGDHKLPATCPPGMVALGSYGSCDAWQGELALDVISAHLIAPYAKILLVVAPADSEISDDPPANVAPPEMMQALEVLASRHLANVVSVSTGTGETTYDRGLAEILAQSPGELAAAAAGIPVVEGTGDCGVVQNLAVANGQCEDVSQTPDTAAWDDSPWITAVGGTTPDFSNTGRRLGPDPLWNIESLFMPGAGFSAVFQRPAYQDGVAHITGSPMRSVPDISLDASDGTSEAGPLLAGILSLATQLNHHNVGPINPALYGVLGPHGRADGIVDVVSGNNSVIRNGKVVVPGFPASKGFDVASGWGTVYAPKFVPALVAATHAMHQEAAYRGEAHAELLQLEHSISLTTSDIGKGGQSYLIGSGLLPAYPIRLSIDRHLIATLTANDLGDVTYLINPAVLKLAPGRHVVELSSMLLTETRTFRSS